MNPNPLNNFNEMIWGTLVILGLGFLTCVQQVSAVTDKTDKTDNKDPIVFQIDTMQSDWSYHSSDIKGVLKAIYQKNASKPLWDQAGKKDVIKAVMMHMGAVERHGIDPATVRPLLNILDNHMQGITTDLKNDVAVTSAIVRYMEMLRYGVISPAEIDQEWVATDEQNISGARMYHELTASSNVSEYLNKLLPQSQDYQRLLKAFDQYDRLARNQEDIQFKSLPTIKPGLSFSQLNRLATYLKVTGHYLGAIPQDNIYRGAIVEAVQSFQQKRGLEMDGVLGPETYQELNRSWADTRRQILVNLERHRWDRIETGESFILVNIPEFNLMVFENGKEALSMKVIVGKSMSSRQTPIITDTLEYLVFRPYWNVPKSIINNEIVPQMRKNPGRYAQKGFQIVDQYHSPNQILQPNRSNAEALAQGKYVLRQKPGRLNPLGRVKFIFPNQDAVYLHDTSNPKLFDESDRNFSHGCIRVSDPQQLAYYVLNQRTDQTWSQEKVRWALESGETQRVNLDRTLPVKIRYYTASTPRSGDTELMLFEDIYQRDAKVWNKMSQKVQQHKSIAQF